VRLLLFILWGLCTCGVVSWGFIVCIVIIDTLSYVVERLFGVRYCCILLGFIVVKEFQFVISVLVGCGWTLFSDSTCYFLYVMSVVLLLVVMCC